jgi:hypothetical protein
MALRAMGRPGRVGCCRRTGLGQVALLWKPSCHSIESMPTEEQQQEETGEEVGDAR